jgi:hypothetical protein
MAMYGVPPGVRELPPQVFGAEAGGQPQAAEEAPVHRARGTMILVLVFLAAFIVYYFVNWKLLSIVWKIG